MSFHWLIQCNVTLDNPDYIMHTNICMTTSRIKFSAAHAKKIILWSWIELALILGLCPPSAGAGLCVRARFFPPLYLDCGSGSPFFGHYIFGFIHTGWVSDGFCLWNKKSASRGSFRFQFLKTISIHRVRILYFSINNYRTISSSCRSALRRYRRVLLFRGCNYCRVGDFIEIHRQSHPIIPGGSRSLEAAEVSISAAQNVRYRHKNFEQIRYNPSMDGSSTILK